jgi:DNA-binding transcriptional MocR family regulator
VALVYEPGGRTAKGLASDIEGAILDGRLAPGDVLPSIRAVAETNGVATATVSAAYRILRDRGLVIGERRRGTRVAGTPDPPLQRATPLSGVVDLSSGNPDPACLPDLRPFFNRACQPSGAYSEAVNLARLIDLARRRLGEEGVPAEGVTVTHGAMDAVERILRLYLRTGDRIAVEDPGYSSIFDVARGLGLGIVPVPLDEYGVIPAALDEALDRHRPKAFVTTPRAHNPTGAAWDEPRRRELRNVLRRHRDVIVIEDDHAGPIAGVPYLPLAISDGRPWAVVRSVSKFLGPDLRLALVAGSERLVGRLEAAFAVGPGWVSHLLQHLVADLLSDPSVDAQLAEASRVYERRRTGLLDALRVYDIRGTARSGLNVWVPVPSEELAVTGLLANGWAVAAGERFRLRTPASIRVTTAELEPEEARRFAACLANVMGGTRRGRLA